MSRKINWAGKKHCIRKVSYQRISMKKVETGIGKLLGINYDSVVLIKNPRDMESY